MLDDEAINRLVEAVYTEVGVIIQIAYVGGMPGNFILEIRWEEGRERYQLSKAVANYPTVGPPGGQTEYIIHELYREIVQRIKDARATRAGVVLAGTNARPIPGPITQYYEERTRAKYYQPVLTPDECHKKPNKLILLC